MALRVVTAREAGGTFATWTRLPQFAAIDRHPFTGGFGRGYYPRVYGDTRRDASFAVVDGDTPRCIVPCSAGGGQLDWYGLPIEVFVAADVANEPAVVALAFQQFDAIRDQDAIGQIRLSEPGGCARLSTIGHACLNRGFHAALDLSAHVDLGAGEAGLRGGLRKSFRSLVNWGRRNITLTTVNAANPDEREFAAYRAFHLAVAGRSTRPEATWTAMFDWIAAGGGELALGRLATGELVSGTMVVDGSKVAYYASGVYDRERFDKPMAHYPLYDAILRAGLRGKTTFDLGDIPQIGTVSQKEHAIGYFKRGFATSIETGIVWTLAQAGSPTSEDGA